MPSEFPVDASESFGEALYPFMSSIIKSDINSERHDEGLPYEISNAVITH